MEARAAQICSLLEAVDLAPEPAGPLSLTEYDEDSPPPLQTASPPSPSRFPDKDLGSAAHI